MLRHVACIVASVVGGGVASGQQALQPLAGPTDDSGNRIRGCAADGRTCAELVTPSSEGATTIRVGARELGLELVPLAGPADGLDYSGASLWPQTVTLGDGVIFGVLLSRSTMYSGGGASATYLVLVEAPAGDAPLRFVAGGIPVGGHAMIRACFSDADRRGRRGVCHDEYDFAGTVSLVATGATGRPVLALTTRATTSPGRLSRDEDNRAVRVPPVGQREWRDPACSYRHLFTFDAGSHTYRPDTPLPACAAYLDF